MWTLSGFSDEIDKDFATQCEVVTGLGLKYIEIRSAWGTNILDLDADQLAERPADPRRARAAGLQHRLADRQDQDHRRLRAAPGADAARRRCRPVAAGAVPPHLLLLHPRGDDPDDHRDEVITRMGRSPTWPSRPAWSPLHENEKEIFGDIPRRCLDIVTAVDSPNLKLAWDPANYVQCGVRPFTEGYAELRPHTAYIQIKDALFADASVVLAGGRRRGARDRPWPCATTASTASSPWSRTSRTQALSAASPAPTCSPRPTRLHRHPAQRGDRVRMSISETQPLCYRLAARRCRSHRPASRQRTSPPWPTRSSWWR